MTGPRRVDSATSAQRRLGQPLFRAAARSAVEALGTTYPADLWLVSELEGATELVVAAAGPWADGFCAGERLPWLGSMDLQMASGPVLASPVDVRSSPEYARAADGRWAGVRTYTGASLLGVGADLHGTLSGYSALDHDPVLQAATPGLVLTAGLLTSVLTGQQQLALLRRQLAAAQVAAEVDELTALANRRGWYAALDLERERDLVVTARAAVLVVDLDDLKLVNDSEGHAAGDALLQRTALVLSSACRAGDVVARAGGDEFAVLAADAGDDELVVLVTRIRAGLAAARIPASVAGVVQRPGEDLRRTWGRADAGMYADKRRRKAARLRGSGGNQLPSTGIA
jgi:diguanylate cyclase (GGDEF)-like protein